MAKEIWVPKSETKVRVTDGTVQVWEDMQFAPRPVNAAVRTTGFSGTTRKDMRRDTMRPTEPPPSGTP